MRNDLDSTRRGGKPRARFANWADFVPGSLAMATIGAMTLLFSSLNAQARDEVPSPDSPFATIPPHLKTTTTTEEGAVRPLLIFQVNLGGSSSWQDTVTLDGQQITGTRWDMFKFMLQHYARKYGNRIQWAFYEDTMGETWNSKWLESCSSRNSCSKRLPQKILNYWKSQYDPRGSNWSYYANKSNVYLDPRYWNVGAGINSYTNVWGDYKRLLDRIEYMQADYNARFRPLSLNYVVSPTLLLRHNIRYRCQPSFYVVMDDGLIMPPNAVMNSLSENSAYALIELAGLGVMPYPYEKMQFKQFTDKVKGGRNGRNRSVYGYDYACMTLLGSNVRGAGNWRTAEPPSDGSCGMRFFSHALANTDLMKASDLPSNRQKDDAGKSWDDPAFPVQSLETFAIRVNNHVDNKGYGSNVDPLSYAQSYFRMKSVASKNEYFFDVKTGKDFENAFDRIFKTVESSIKYGSVKSYSTISPVLGAPEAKPVPGSAANVRLNMFDGSSEIRFHKVSHSSDPDKYKYMEDDPDNKSVLDEAASYKIDIELDKFETPKFDDRTPLFGWKDDSYLMNSIDSMGLGNKEFKVSRSHGVEWREGLLKWLTRLRPDEDIHDERDYSLVYRVRKQDSTFDNRSMGDIIDTPVLDIGEYLATAANDGMVYVFKKSAKDNGRFSLKLNYLPMDVVRESDDDLIKDHYHLLPDPAYAQSPDRPHQFMINGGMTWRLTAPNAKKNRNLIVAGSYGQGGRGAYVLLIAGNDLSSGAPVGIEADKSKWPSTVPLFSVSAKDEKNMGYTFGDPQIGQIVKTRTTHSAENGSFTTTFNADHYLYGLFLSSGFNNPKRGVWDTESALYVYNIFNYQFGADYLNHEDDPGELLTKIVADPSGGGLAQSTLMDYDNDGIVDLAYAGDYKGTLYRFDFRHGLKKATAVPIFKAPAGQRFTSAPAIMKVIGFDKDTKKEGPTGEVMVIIGTGSDIYEDDENDKSQNAVYGIRDNLKIAQPEAMSVNDLRQQRFYDDGMATDRRGTLVETRNIQSVKIGDKKGWYMNLSEKTGERVVTKPLVYDGMALVTTRMYNVISSTSSPSSNHQSDDDPCVAKESTQKTTGGGWIMQFDALTGAGPKEFDYTSDEKQAAYIDFMGHLEDKNKPIVSGLRDPQAGIPNLTMSGDKPLLTGLNIMKGVDFDRMLPMDANFEGDIGGSGVSGEIPKLYSLKKQDKRDYNLHELKYDRTNTVPALFTSTSAKGLQEPYTLAIKKLRKPKPTPAPAGQAQILKRLSFKVLD